MYVNSIPIPVLIPIHAGSFLSIKAILSLLTIPEVLYLIILKLVVAIPVGVFRVMFSYINIDKFGLTARTNGYLLTYTGIISAVRKLNYTCNVHAFFDKKCFDKTNHHYVELFSLSGNSGSWCTFFH